MPRKFSKKRRPRRDITTEINAIADGTTPSPDVTNRDGKKGTKRRATKILQCKEYIQMNPSATNDQVALAIDCHRRTVSLARRALRKLGLVPPVLTDHRSTDYAATLDTEGAEELRRTIEAAAYTPGTELSIEDLRKMVSQLVYTAKRENNHNLLASVSGLLLKIDDKLGGKTQLGPPPPLSEKDKIERLGVLLDVCGPSITASAATATFSPADLKLFLDEIGTVLSKISPSTAEMPIASPTAVENLTYEDQNDARG